MNNFFSHKVFAVFKYLNTIAVQQDNDPMIDVGCNGFMLRRVLIGGGTDVNVMTIPAMRYIGLQIERAPTIILK